MGLSSNLGDISGDSIPILLVAAAAGWVSHLRSLLVGLRHPFGRPSHHDHRHEDADAAAVGSALAGLIMLAEQLDVHRAFSYGEGGEGHRAAAAPEPDCVVCLDALREGERVRRLGCCGRAFHSECLDGWFDQRKLTCPLCRSPLVAEGRLACAARRVGADLADWFGPH